MILVVLLASCWGSCQRRGARGHERIEGVRWHAWLLGAGPCPVPVPLCMCVGRMRSCTTNYTCVAAAAPASACSECSCARERGVCRSRSRSSVMCNGHHHHNHHSVSSSYQCNVRIIIMCPKAGRVSPAPLACIFGIRPACISPVILPVSHRILGIPLYPCIDLYLAILQQIHCIPLPAASHCIQLYPCLSSC